MRLSPQIDEFSGITSTAETRVAPNIPKIWLALKLGAPHWNGYGNLTLGGSNVKKQRDWWRGPRKEGRGGAGGFLAHHLEDVRR